ncbi:MAG: type IV pilus twitching motility protein PilT [Erysipelotrichaceae bacterium]|nr:type IV pilus twitching motility protein PilT [Erysipelotrichaceae bacterium]
MDMLQEILKKAQDEQCSDIHISGNEKVLFRKDGRLLSYSDDIMSSEDTLSLVNQLIDTKHSELYTLGGDVDAAYTDEFNNRYRLNVYRQRGVPAIAIRLLRNTIPTLKELKMPDVLGKLAMLPRGLVLVTGPTGSGKSTTLAAMIDHINRNRSVHILTLEDPIEYIHTANKGMIHQREIHTDANDFASALRSALREDPDVILVGEMRDHETIALALTAAETGHLVLSTLHTTGAANTIDRIIDVFPPHQQGQIRTQLASSLQGVISQDLLPLEGGLGRIAAHEILLMTDAVANLIRENKIVQINSAIQTGMKLGMCTLDGSLVNLIRKNLISLDTAMENTSNPEALKRLLQNF